MTAQLLPLEGFFVTRKDHSMSDEGDFSDKEKEVEMVYGDSQDPTYSGPDRRSGKDRRSGEDRRKGQDENYQGPERRSGIERRSGEDRRQSS